MVRHEWGGDTVEAVEIRNEKVPVIENGHFFYLFFTLA